jgi:hypothetical protein
MAPIYLVAYELSRTIDSRRSRLEFDRVAKLTLGAVLGFAVYFVLHPHIVGLISNALGWNNRSIHFLYPYFFGARLYRHLPELGVFAVCLLVHIWRRDYKQWPFPLVASLATLFIGFLIPHSNYFYTPFWYFPSFLLVFLTATAASRAIVVPLLVLVLFVPQYAVGYVEGHKYARQDELLVARLVIARHTANLSQAHIFGEFIFWHVFKDLSFKWAPAARYNPPSGTSYLICGLDPPFSPEERVCADELPHFSGMQLVDRFSWVDRKYLIYERIE